LKSVFFEIYRISKIGARTVINIGDGANGSISTSSDVIHFMKDIGFSTYTHIIWNKHQVSNRTSWGSWLSPSCPSFPIPYEHILIFYKKSKKLNHKGITDLLRDEFIKWAYGIWEFAPEKRQKKMGHNAIFPLELPKRCIKMLSYINDIIIDPFNGLGTTTLAAKQLNRKFIGIEISENYCKIANERLAN
jgi:site-specific DNA-methyltransferase (adenine-specific)